MQVTMNDPEFRQADLLLELPVEKPKKPTRNYKVEDVIAFINANRLPDGTFKIHDIRGTVTKWKQEFTNVVPDESSRVFELFEREAIVLQGHNAVQGWQRVCFRVGGANGFARALFLDEIDGVVTLSVDQDILNVPAQ